MALEAIAHSLAKLSAAVAKVIAVLAVVLFAVVVILNGWEAAARYFFAASSIYTVEISLVVASVVYFVGYARLLHDDEDVRMGYLVDKLPERAQRAIDLLNEICTLVFFTALVYGSWGYFTLTSGIPHVLFPFHQGYVVLPVLVGALICLVMTLSRILKATTHTASGR